MMPLIVVALIEVILCIVVLSIVPKYGFTIGFVATCLALGLGWSAHAGYLDADMTEALVLGVYCVYILIGFWRIRLKKQKSVLKEKRRQEVLAERQKTMEDSAAYRLGKAAFSSTELKRAFRRFKALSTDSLDEESVSTIVTQDAVSVIRTVALATDHIRGTDAISLKNVAEGALYFELSSIKTTAVVEIIEKMETVDLNSLTLLRDIGSPELQLFSEYFTNFVHELAGPERSNGVQQAIALIQSFTKPQRSTEELLEQFQGILGELKDLESHITATAYELLDVQPGFTQQELRTSYRQKIQEWHPDRLESMAPELKAFATEQLARINLAYKELSHDT